MYARSIINIQRKNMKYKAVFSDFDGTLYSDSYTVSEKNIQAIHDYIARGGKFFVATGRLFQAIYPHLQTIGLTSGEVIVYQGGGIFDIASKKALWNRTLDTDISVDCLKRLEEEKDVVNMVYIDDLCYAERPHPAIDMFCRICNIGCNFVNGKLSDFVRDNNYKPDKLLSMAEPSKAIELSQKYRGIYDGKLSFNRSQPFLVEFTAYGLSKGNAVKQVCEKYGIKREEIICIGDADNDISMIEYAGLGIAVQNAMQTTKDRADVIGVSNNHDAIAWVIENYCKD